MNCGRSRIYFALVLYSLCMFWSAVGVTQDGSLNQQAAQPRFAVIAPRPAVQDVPFAAGTLQEWNGSFTYNGVNYPYVMVGADPSMNQGAVISTWIIPVKIVLAGGQTFDPLAGGTNSALSRTVLSPIFDSSTTYIQGGVNVGTTQYIDAFQRANFWSVVQNNPNSHLLLGGPASRVTVLPELILNVPPSDGQLGTPFGHQVAEVDLNYFDSQITNFLAENNVIMPTGFPIFETYDTYLTVGGNCCIGGYHSAIGGQTYAHFSYIGYEGDFSEDVSGLSNIAGDWADDPFYPAPNVTPCGGLSVGGPLGASLYPYQLHGFTYHLQDLAFLRYFGGPADGSVNDWWSFQNYPFNEICQNGDNR